MERKDKKCVIAIVVCTTGCFFLGYFCHCFQVQQKTLFLTELVHSWTGFEAKYTEDIKNIDALRDDLRSLRQERDEWEKIAYEFKDEALDFKMKYKECYTALFLEGV